MESTLQWTQAPANDNAGNVDALDKAPPLELHVDLLSGEELAANDGPEVQANEKLVLRQGEQCREDPLNPAGAR